jgi:hypothetical protein
MALRTSAKTGARDDDCHDIKHVLAYDCPRFDYVYRALDRQSCSQGAQKCILRSRSFSADHWSSAAASR